MANEADWESDMEEATSGVWPAVCVAQGGMALHSAMRYIGSKHSAMPKLL